MSDTDHGATAPSVTSAPKTALVAIAKPAGPAPAHAFDPRKDESTKRGTNVLVSRESLFLILEQLKQLSPCHKDPHRFHERKDELVSLLYGMATAS